MKYAVFALTLLAAFPAAVFGSMSRRILAVMMALMFVVVLKFDSMAVNFISYEFYRGTSRGMEVSLAYIIALAVFLAVVMARSSRGIRYPSILASWGTWLFLAYFVWGCVSAVANNNMHVVPEALVEGRLVADFRLQGRMLSFFELWKMGMMFLVYIAVHAYLSYQKDVRAILRAVSFVCIVCFLMVVHEHYSGIYQVRGPFPHQNSLAMFMMLVGPVLFGVYLNVSGSGFRNLCMIAFVGASASLFRTYSRASILCYPVAVGLVGSVSLLTRLTSRKVRRLMPLVLIGMLGITLLLPRIIDRFENAPVSSGDKRLFFARTALNTIADYPVTGVGINNWAVFLNERTEYLDDDPSGLDEKGDMGIVETIYLLTAAECGWVGLALLLSWFLYYWFVALRLSFRLSHTEWAYLPMGIWGGLTGCYLQSGLEWVLKQQVNFLMLMVVFAMLAWLNQNWRALAAESRGRDGAR